MAAAALFTDTVRRLRTDLTRRGRRPGLRTAKTTLAAVLSYVIARRLGTSAQPILAPLTALLVVQLTLYETVTHGIGRIVSVLAGVLLAVGLAEFVGLTWWSLGAVVALSLIVGRLLRLGQHLLEVPISAMLVLAVGGSEAVAAGRVYETLLGAAVGVGVNLAIAPPLYVQPAGDALGELADRMAGFLRGLGEQLAAGWSRAEADTWLDRARALGAEVARADTTIVRAEQSARLNPRGAEARVAQPRLRIGLTGLEHCYAALRSLCRALLDRTFFVPDAEQATAFTAEVRTALAAVVAIAGSAIEQVGMVTSVPPGSPTDHKPLDRLETLLGQLRESRDRLATLLVVDPTVDQGAWQQHGALLAAVDLLRVEVEAAVRPPDGSWRPPPVTAHQREAVRRLVKTGAERRRARRRRHRRA